jgi:25S rRNA (uracil2634-N3)-methyltransferase
MRVLCVGDGDFTFSLAISKVVLSSSTSSGMDDARNDGGTGDVMHDIVGGGGGSRYKKGGGGGGMVVATSYEDAETLRSVYPDFDDTLRELTGRGGDIGGADGVVVGYNVDATRLVETLPHRAISKRMRRHRPLPRNLNPSSSKSSPDGNDDEGTKYHRICWNFPCTAISSGQDGQNDAMDRNRELIRRFVSNSLPLLDTTCGEVHMIHKTKPPYNQWLLEEVALQGTTTTSSSSSDGGGGNNGNRTLEYKGRIVFDRCIYRPYTPRKALDRRSFPCHDACVYVFGWRGEDDDVDGGNDDVDRWKTIPPLSARSDRAATVGRSPHDDDDYEALTERSLSIMPVTAELIDEIRSMHIAYARERKADGKKRSHSSFAPPSRLTRRTRRK